MNKLNRFFAAALAAVAVMFAAGAQAHHSVAPFDRNNPVTLSGTVKEFKYTNPHTWIYLMVPDGKGGEQQWELEGGSVNMVVRQGWTNKTLGPGMKVKLLIAPRRDGNIGGEWLRVLELEGKPFEVKSDAQ
ncbi:MAG: DUF6152 family protein [Steroidobacteraceae bacterium]